MYIPTDDRSTDEKKIEFLTFIVTFHQKNILNSERKIAEAKEALAIYRKSGEQS